MKTKNGIELNLKESNYRYTFSDLVFYFSSDFYKTKFKNELNNFINIETIKLINKYKTNINLQMILAIALYKKIEKRGFYVIYRDSIIIHDDVKFDIYIK